MNYADARFKQYNENTEEQIKAGTISEENAESRMVVGCLMDMLIGSIKSSISTATEEEPEEIPEEEELSDSEDSDDEVEDTEDKEDRYCVVDSICHRALDVVLNDPLYESYTRKNKKGFNESYYREIRNLCVPHIKEQIKWFSTKDLKKLSLGHLDAAADIAFCFFEERDDIIARKRLNLWK